MSQRFELINPFDHDIGTRVLVDMVNNEVVGTYQQDQREEAEKERDRRNDRYELYLRLRSAQIRNMD
jgi:hypothetical protein